MAAISFRWAIVSSLSFEALQKMIADPQRVGHRCQSRIHRADAREETGVHHVEVVELVRLAVGIEHRSLWVLAEAASPGLVRDTTNADLILHVQIARN